VWLIEHPPGVTDMAKAALGIALETDRSSGCAGMGTDAQSVPS
jgi:hypothetical protein